MFNPNFLNALEYQINNDLQNLNDHALEGYFCEGLMQADDTDNFNKKYIEEKKIVMLQAYLGTDAGSRYDVVLKFGPQALDCVKNDRDLMSCIPAELNAQSLRIVPEEALMEIQLN